MSTRSLARLAVSLALFLGLAVVTGCAKTKEETKVRKDGTGTTKMTTTIDLTKLQALQEMMQGMGMGGGGEGMGGDPVEDLDPEKYKKKVEDAEGVRLMSMNRKIDEEKKTMNVVIELEFDSLEHLYKSGLVQSVEATLTKNEDGSYTLERSLGGDYAPAASDNPEAAAFLEGILAMVEPFMSEMELSSTLTFPTPISESDGVKGEEGNSVTWSVGFKDVSNPKKRGQKVTFGGEGLEWKPFSTQKARIKMEEPAEEEVKEE
jgi:hypothetical protein